MPPGARPIRNTGGGKRGPVRRRIFQFRPLLTR
jgi:hypothetical protein